MEDEVENAWAALTVLAGYLPDREEARRRIADTFLRGFVETGAEVPDWIDELRRRVGKAG